MGGLAGLGISLLALLPALAAGEKVPLASFGIAILLIATSTLVPYLFVRWRWHVIRNRHEG